MIRKMHKTIVSHFNDAFLAGLVREYMRHKFKLFGVTCFPRALFYKHDQFKPCSIIESAFSWSYVANRVEQNQFEQAKKEGPIHPCDTCHMLCFRHYIIKVRSNNTSWICKRCIKQQKNGKI